jgi:tetratricopeptide (TPR) repeat protein
MGVREKLPLSLAFLGAACWFCGDFDRAYVCVQESLAIIEEMDDPAGLGFATAFRAFLDTSAGRYDAARQYAKEAISIYQAGSNNIVYVFAKGMLGWAAVAQKDYESAIQALQQAITATREMLLADMVGEYKAWSLSGLGTAAFGLRKRADAKQHVSEALEIAIEFRAFLPLVFVMPVIPLVMADEAHRRREIGLTIRAVEIHTMARSHPFVAKARLFEDIAGAPMRATIASLPPDVAAAAQARGRGLDWWETADALLVELRSLGWGA